MLQAPPFFTAHEQWASTRAQKETACHLDYQRVADTFPTSAMVRYISCSRNASCVVVTPRCSCVRTLLLVPQASGHGSVARAVERTPKRSVSTEGQGIAANESVLVLACPEVPCRCLNVVIFPLLEDVMCHGCKEFVSSNTVVLEAMGRTWHNSCFT